MGYSRSTSSKPSSERKEIRQRNHRSEIKKERRWEFKIKRNEESLIEREDET